MKTKEEKAAYNKAYYAANRERLCALQRERDKLPHNVARRVAYDKEKPPAKARAMKAWLERYPERKRAQGALQDAVRRGKIERPKLCPKCGKKGRIEGHHKDYSKPLEVDWLCHPCHIEEHNSMRAL
jgi:hypothetical protein